MSAAAAQAAALKKQNQEQIVAGFNELRQKQQAIGSKLSELEVERREHEIIISTLKEVDPSRRSFQMVGGVLFEKTAGETIPALEHTVLQLTKAIAGFEGQIQSVGQELVDYRQKHGIRVQGPGGSAGGAAEEGESRKVDDSRRGGNSGVLTVE